MLKNTEPLSWEDELEGAYGCLSSIETNESSTEIRDKAKAAAFRLGNARRQLLKNRDDLAQQITANIKAIWDVAYGPEQKKYIVPIIPEIRV